MKVAHESGEIIKNSLMKVVRAIILCYNIDMKYLRRKADQFLKQWQTDPEHYPLIVKGARQVGKTETIRHFAVDHYASVIEINFITDPVYKTIIDEGFSAEKIVKRISLINPWKKFIPGETLIFFDEIQAFPEIATALKFFREDGRFDVICSGSLLGIQYKHIASISVGSKTDYQMYSMDFEEYLWALGYEQNAIDRILNHMLEIKAFTSAEHQLFSNLFLEYCVLGGMPRVVLEYVERKTFDYALSLQRQLLTDIESDIRKYAESLDQTKIVSVYRSIPSQLARENKKFQFSRVRKGGRSRDYMGCVEWLKDAGLVNICYCLNFPELPLRGNIEEGKFKVYMSDTGLLMASLDEETQFDVRANRNLGVYKGALYENFTAESLAKQGFDLYYYKKENATLEEDFFIRGRDTLVPVEVKAVAGNSKSLKTLIKSPHYEDIHFGIRITAGNVGYQDKIFTFPHFCAFLLKRWIREQRTI